MHRIFSSIFYKPLFLPIIIFSTLISCQKSATKEDQLAEEIQLTDAEKRLPQNALVGMEVVDGLEATLFAHEPMLVNPTSMDIDAKGRIWVCEGYNYRPPLNPDNPVKNEGDRIIILEDTNGDGKADTSKVFYQGNDVNAALGIAVLGSKIIVSRSPNVLVFTDENGDDLPDNKQVMFSKLGGLHHDHGVHTFVFGPDGKLYFNMGNAGEQLADRNGSIMQDVNGLEIRNNGKPYREGMLFRTDFEGSEVEVLGHNFRNPYEMALDSYGNIWQSDNDDDGNQGVRINFILPYGNYGYKDEMTGAGWRTKRTGMHREIPIRHWHQNDPGVVPNLLQTGAGSPTGMVFYEGTLLPEQFQQTMIHTDAGPNVVRAYPTQKAGAGYKAEIVNIMKSNHDQWFRPSDICVAPDGSLFVADWYDPGVGGHRVDDQQQGRIYRIAPENSPYNVNSSTLNSPSEAVEALKNPNLATRYLAWNKLKNWETEAEAALNDMFKAPESHFQARALWLLAQINGSTSEYIEKGLAHSNEDIKITALKIAQLYDQENLPGYLNTVIDDPSVQVKREAITALHKVDISKAVPIWTELALKYQAGDRWYLETLGAVSDRQPEAFFTQWRKAVGEDWKSAAGQDIVWRLRAPETMPLLAELIESPDITLKDMNRYFRAFDFHSHPSKETTLISMLKGTHPRQNEINKLVITHVPAQAAKTSPQLKAALDQTLLEIKGTELFIDWVGKFKLTNQVKELEKLMMADPNGNLGIAAGRILYQWQGVDYFKNLLTTTDQTQLNNTITLLSNLGGNETWELLKDLAIDDTEDMILRRKAIKAMGKGWTGEKKLFEMLKNDLLPDTLVDITANTLLSAIRSEIREEAAKYLTLPEDTALPPVRELVALEGLPENGAVIFQKLCQTCHQVDGTGTQFGPDLSEIGNKLSKEGLYGAILYPDAGINFGYEGYLVETTSGETVVGYISSNTEDAIELTKIGGIKTIYPKSEIVAIKELENSLMTSGLHRAMSSEELVDLVAYLSDLGKES